MPADPDRPLLLLGCDGQVGREVRRLAAARGYGVVVNAAAYTAVDRAEGEAARAMAVNRDGAGQVAEACQAGGADIEGGR